MTRDEATKAAREVWADPGRIVDCFVKLGMLTLDEPKTATDKAFDVMNAVVGNTYACSVLKNLDTAGLRIVEK